MLQVSPQTPIFLVHNPVDFRKGIESLAGYILEQLQIDIYSGALVLFRNKKAQAIKVVFYDGTGMWLCLKRLSKGSFKYWPCSEEKLSFLKAQELLVLLWQPFWFRLSERMEASYLDKIKKDP